MSYIQYKDCKGVLDWFYWNIWFWPDHWLGNFTLYNKIKYKNKAIKCPYCGRIAFETDRIHSFSYEIKGVRYYCSYCNGQ